MSTLIHLAVDGVSLKQLDTSDLRVIDDTHQLPLVSSWPKDREISEIELSKFTTTDFKMFFDRVEADLDALPKTASGLLWMDIDFRLRVGVTSGMSRGQYDETTYAKNIRALMDGLHTRALTWRPQLDFIPYGVVPFFWYCTSADELMAYRASVEAGAWYYKTYAKRGIASTFYAPSSSEVLSWDFNLSAFLAPEVHRLLGPMAIHLREAERARMSYGIQRHVTFVEMRKATPNLQPDPVTGEVWDNPPHALPREWLRACLAYPKMAGVTEVVLFDNTNRGDPTWDWTQTFISEWKTKIAPAWRGL